MKYCTHCGAEHQDEAVFCTKCGCKLDNVEVVDNTAVQSEAKSKENNYAIAGMVLGIVSLVLFSFPAVGLVCSILGLVFSCLARKQVKNGYSTAGFVTSIICLSIYAIVVIIFMASFGFASIFWAYGAA